MKRAILALCLSASSTLAVAVAAPERPPAAQGSVADAGREDAVWVLRFEADASQLSAAHRRMLDEVAERLAANPRQVALIVGHSDDLGSEPASLEISRRRAEAARTYLTQHRGVTGHRLVVEAKGSVKPVASNETAEGRRRNRRVVVALRENAEARRRAMGTWVVYFDPASSQLSSAARELLDEVAEELQRDPRLRALIVGHTDGSGHEPNNLRVSNRRAEEATSYLTRQRGIDRRRIRTQGKGSLKPVASNETAEGRRRNRRAVVVIEGRPATTTEESKADVPVRPAARGRDETAPAAAGSATP